MCSSSAPWGIRAAVAVSPPAVVKVATRAGCSEAEARTARIESFAMSGDSFRLARAAPNAAGPFLRCRKPDISAAGSAPAGAVANISAARVAAPGRSMPASATTAVERVPNGPIGGGQLYKHLAAFRAAKSGEAFDGRGAERLG